MLSKQAQLTSFSSSCLVHDDKSLGLFVCLFACFALFGGFQQHEHRVRVVSYLPSMSHEECYLPSMFHILSLLFSFFLSPFSFFSSLREKYIDKLKKLVLQN